MTEEEFDELRPSAFAIAYRMLGSVSEAEDVVQEGFLRLHRAREGGERIESPRAYLSTVVSRLSLDHLRSARVRRETYVGEWLPEPLVTERRRRSRPQGRDGGLAVARLPRPAREPVARAARRVPAARGVRRALRPDRGDRRHERAERPPARHAGPPPRRGAAPPVRGLARAAARSSRPASSRPPRTAISKGWRSCWPTTSCSAATAAARRPPPHAPSTAAPRWRAC